MITRAWEFDASTHPWQPEHSHKRSPALFLLKRLTLYSLTSVHNLFAVACCVNLLCCTYLYVSAVTAMCRGSALYDGIETTRQE